jgi:hypothetical protein
MNRELIELITDTVSKRNEIDALSIYNACENRGFVRGTYTSYISMMKKAGYLRRVKPQVYAIGKPASAQTIALNLQRLTMYKKGMPQKNFKPKDPITLPSVENLTDGNAYDRMLGAIRVLKSFGLKVTIEF